MPYLSVVCGAPRLPRATSRSLLPWLAVTLVFWAFPSAGNQIRLELEADLAAVPTAELQLFEIEALPGVGVSAKRLAPASRLADGTLAVEVKSGETTRLLLRAPGIWSPPCETAQGTCRFEIEPGGLAAFRFSDSSGGAPALPEVIVARGWRRSASAPEAEVPVFCHEWQRRVWGCALPLGRLDLRLDVPGFATVFEWDLEAGADSDPERPIEIRVLRGAHVEGWLDAGAGTARLRPAGKWRHISEERLSFATREVEIGADGRLAFEHVAPGRYELTVTSPRAGRAELELTVEPEDERVVLGDIRLRLPERAEIQVDPPMDGWGEPWRVALSRVEEGARGAVRRLVLDLTGYGFVEGLSPGRYYVNVRDSQDSVWHLAAHDLDAVSPLILSIPHVPVEGRVRTGDEPLATTLVFGTTQGAQQVGLRSDERGRFEGYLPEEGLWEVELGDAEAGCDRCEGELGVTLLPPVEVEVGPSGKALVEIVLPDTLVEGTIVRGPPGEDVPVPGAQVVAVRPHGPPDRLGRLAQVWSDDEGRFALRGMEPGPVTVLARTDSGEAQSSIELVEGRELPEIELRIEEQVAVQVRVTHAGTAVAGARVHALPGRGFSAHATTDLDGRADLRLAARSWGALLVDPPGLGLHLERFEVGDESPPPRDLETGLGSGDLLLVGFKAPPLRGSLMRRGAAVELHVLRNFSHGRVTTTEAGVVYAGLEAGEYSVCLGSGANCRRVTVPPSGTVSLSRSDSEESTK